MLKYVAPLASRLRHLERPALFRAHHADDGGDTLKAGQRIAERVAGALGSWGFIGAQAGVMVLWVLLNTAIVFFRWDAYPFVFLNLAMSAEAAFTGPVLLIAANVGAARDHAQAARMERLEHTVLDRLDALEQRLTPPVELAPRVTTAPKTATARAPKTSAARKA